MQKFEIGQKENKGKIERFVCLNGGITKAPKTC